MTDALVSLVSSIVGGLLVLSGNFLVKRTEDRRAWLMRLHDAAGALVASYLQEVATINDRRRTGSPLPVESLSTYVVDRQRALGLFRTLPWSAQFEVERQAMGLALQRLWEAGRAPDQEFERRHRRAREAAFDFTDAVANHIARRGAGK